MIEIARSIEDPSVRFGKLFFVYLFLREIFSTVLYLPREG